MIASLGSKVMKQVRPGPTLLWNCILKECAIDIFLRADDWSYGSPSCWTAMLWHKGSSSQVARHPAADLGNIREASHSWPL